MKSLGICLWCASVGVLLSGLASQSGGDEPNTTATEQTGSFCHCADDNPVATDRILHRLSEPLHSSGLDFAEEPLENVVNFLQDEYKIPIQIDRAALEDAGLTTDEKISIRVNNVSLKAGLRLLLKHLQLTYVLQDEVLTITTPEEAEAELGICVYDVRDILVHQSLPAQGRGAAGLNFDPLIDVITSCVANNSWSESGGGAAEIRPLPPGLLVIAQTRAVHEEIGELLATIRETLRQPAPGSHLQPEAAAMGMEMGMEETWMGMGMGARGEEGMEGGMMGGRGSTPEPTPAEQPFE